MFIFRKLTPAAAREVPLTIERELGVGAAMDLVSPALSTRVLRLGSGSFTKLTQYTEMKGIACHLHGPLSLCLRLDGGSNREGCCSRELLCDWEIS